jgi:hypothetical protein
MIWQKGGNPDYSLQPPLGWDLNVRNSAFADLDSDGDLDLMVSNNVPFPHYFENIGNSTTPKFIRRNGIDNPWNNIDISYEYISHLINDHFEVSWESRFIPLDLDDDGDIDFLLAGYGSLIYIENIGTPTQPNLIRRNGINNPFRNLHKNESILNPTILDLDNDKDLDMFIGVHGGTFLYFENIGNAKKASFIRREGVENPLNNITLGFRAVPAAIDLDKDGDLDLVIGYNQNHEPFITYIENIGSPIKPLFIKQQDANNPFVNIKLIKENNNGFVIPLLVDLDGDNDLDLVLPENSGASLDQGGNGRFLYFENISILNQSSFTQKYTTNNPFYGVRIDSRFIKPHLLDLDNDADLDLLLTSKDGSIYYFKNISETASPNFVQQYDINNPFNDINMGTLSVLNSLDLDNDGDLDIVIGHHPGHVSYFENIGTPSIPSFMKRTDMGSPLNIISAIDSDKYYLYSILIHPIPADMDNDGDIDMILFNSSNPQPYSYFENIGNKMVPQYIERHNTANILYGENFLSAPHLFDFDNDGDFDLIFNKGAVLKYMENIGNSTTANFILHEQKNNSWHVDEVSKKVYGAPASIDLEGDGDLDLLLTSPSSYIFLLENKNLTDHERVFNWAESIAPNLLPTPAETLDASPFHVRFYPKTGIYLGYNTVDYNVYWYEPPYTDLVNLGALDTYLMLTQTAGF